MLIRWNCSENVRWQIILFADTYGYICHTEEYARLLIAAADCNCARISIRVYAPEPNARFRTGQGGLRGRRSTGHEESEIDKAHVLHAAESPWLEVSTVGLSCRLLIAGTMQQMALIAIPTLRSSRSRILLRSLSLSCWTAFPFLRPPPLSPPFFSHPSSRASSPPIRSRHLATPCVRFHLADKRTT